jgi:hypothetical protein
MAKLEIKTNSYNTAVGQPNPSIISNGHHYWIDKDGNEHITFFNNPTGRFLKKMWQQLNKPIRRKRNGKQVCVL